MPSTSTGSVSGQSRLGHGDSRAALEVAARDAAGAGLAASARGRAAGRGERSRLQLHFELGGSENLSILAVNVLAVDFSLPLPPLFSH